MDATMQQLLNKILLLSLSFFVYNGADDQQRAGGASAAIRKFLDQLATTDCANNKKTDATAEQRLDENTWLRHVYKIYRSSGVSFNVSMESLFGMLNNSNFSREFTSSVEHGLKNGQAFVSDQSRFTARRQQLTFMRFGFVPTTMAIGNENYSLVRLSFDVHFRSLSERMLRFLVCRFENAATGTNDEKLADEWQSFITWQKCQTVTSYGVIHGQQDYDLDDESSSNAPSETSVTVSSPGALNGETGRLLNRVHRLAQNMMNKPLDDCLKHNKFFKKFRRLELELTKEQQDRALATADKYISTNVKTTSSAAVLPNWPLKDLNELFEHWEKIRQISNNHMLHFKDRLSEHGGSYKADAIIFQNDQYSFTITLVAYQPLMADSVGSKRATLIYTTQSFSFTVPVSYKIVQGVSEMNSLNDYVLIRITHAYNTMNGPQLAHYIEDCSEYAVTMAHQPHGL